MPPLGSENPSLTRRALAAVRSGASHAIAPLQQAGPALTTQPITPMGYSPGVAILSAATNFAGGIRDAANYRAALAAKRAQDAQKDELATASLAHMRADTARLQRPVEAKAPGMDYTLPDGTKVQGITPDSYMRAWHDDHASAAPKNVDLSLITANPHLTFADLGRPITEPDIMTRMTGRPVKTEDPSDPPVDDDTMRGMINQYATGNGVPSFGMSKNGASAKKLFYTTVGKMVASGDDPGTSAGIAKSERGNMNKLQEQAGFLASYGGALDRNMDVLMSTVARVQDTGSPILNHVVRVGSKVLIGDTDVTDFQAALTPVRKEAARILEGGMMGGGQVSVAGNKDLKEIAGENFTRAQLDGVIRILRTEKMNRVKASNQALKESQDRLHALGMVTLPGEHPPAGAGASGGDGIPDDEALKIYNQVMGIH